MFTDENVNSMLDTVRMITRENEGVVIEPIGLNQGILRIKYYQGTNAECPECILSPEEFKNMVERMCRVQAPNIISIELESVD